MSKNPVLIPQAFAANGSKNNIQNTRQAGQDPEDATWSDGFPNVTMQPIESGGLPPKGMDFNGIFNALSATIVHLQKGNLFYFDKAYCDAFGGYQKGSILQADDGTKIYVSVADKNTNNPNQNPKYWEVIAGIGLNAASASKLFEGRNIGGVFFDGTQDIDLPGVNTRGNQDTTGNASTATYAGQIAARKIGGVTFNAKTDIDLPGVNIKGNQDTSGNAATATKLQNAACINGIPFDGSKDINATPAGAVQFFAMNTAPVGWLKANGAAVSRTSYASLYAAIGTRFGAGDGKSTFNLPDLRGEFLRAYDEGRGVDDGRQLGTAQSDTVQRMTGEIGDITFVGKDYSNGVFSRENVSTAKIGTVTPLTLNFKVKFDNAAVARTSAETRPRNIALLACIKI
ncbi:phage tail protein [Snodgrassella alvi]|uniref:phage tail protein n=1 Tax=Snodgrassella alvi TaxID=1196083 RepID=UPI00351CAFF1